MCKPTKTIVFFQGNIGAGKSTLINKIAANLRASGHGVSILQEDVKGWENDGFIQKFYNNTKKHAFEFQCYVTTERCGLYTDLTKFDNEFILAERSLLEDVIFASANCICGTITDDQLHIHEKIVDCWIQCLENTFKLLRTCYELRILYVCVDTTKAVRVHNINKRNRGYELGMIGSDYDKELDRAYAMLFANSAQRNSYNIECQFDGFDDRDVAQLQLAITM